MSVKQVSTLHCDSCDQRHTSQEAHFSFRTPDGWAEIDIDWTDQAGDQHHDLWHLCPKCSGELLAAIMLRRTTTGGTP